MFTSISLEKWRQFESVNIDLSSPMTVITGANGSGKTTILNILSRHFGWNLNWTSTRSGKKSKSKFWSDYWDLWDESFAPKADTVQIGQLRYASGNICELRIPVSVNEEYNINYKGQESVNGLHIPSHTQPFTYQKVQTVKEDEGKPKSSSFL